MHGFEGYRQATIEMTVPRARKGRSRLAIVHRSDFLQPTRVRGIPCLTVAHTLFSLTGRTSSTELDATVDDLLARRLVGLDELQDRFATWAPRRRPGVDQLRTILDEKGGGFVPPVSELERMLRSLLSDPTLPTFQYEYELPWWPRGEGRVDAYAPECSLIVEADGRAWHVRERSQVKDRRRDNLATANGHGTLRLTWVDLTTYLESHREIVRQTAAVRSGLTASLAALSTAAVVNAASDPMGSS